MASKYRKPHNIPYSKVIEYFREKHGKAISNAFEAFLETVAPRNDLTHAEDKMLTGAFFEWFVFDYIFEGSQTPLMHFTREEGDQLSNRTRRAFSQSVDSHFSGHFRITGLNRDACKIELEKIGSGQKYEIYDVAMSGSLPGGFGLIGTRLVSVNNEWLAPGNPVYYLPVEPDSEMIELLRDGDRETVTFIDIVRLHYSQRPEL